ncbi:MAG: hypothetical protein GXC73_16980 [Chitinophagaceae bacterium]|nr:hypothetical protein [Chitinophagaceae bacterium]
MKLYTLFFGIWVIFFCGVDVQKDFNWLKKSTTTKCKKVKGWASSYNIKAEYRHFKKQSLINGKVYNIIKFDFENNKSSSSAYIRVSHDSIYWLNVDFQNLQDSAAKREQLFLYFGDKGGAEWDIISSSYLLGNSHIILQGSKKISAKEDYYTFIVKRNNKGVSDYVGLKKIIVSTVRGFREITIEQANGTDIVCEFK